MTEDTTASIDETSGGEIIYSDAGLEPVNPTKPPIVHQQQQQSAGDSSAESVLNSDQISPQAAFEIFQGKIYSASIPTSSSNNTNSNAAASSSGAGGDESSPLERLARLQQEVTALEAELKMTAAADSGRAFDEQVVQLATDLKNRLVATSSAHVTEQDDLTRLIHEQLQNIQKKDATASAAAAAAAADGVVSLPQTGLVYELYGNATNPTTTMEERLLNLERLLGNSQQQNASSSSSSSSQTNSTSTNHKSLLHRLEEMETLVATVDSTTLEKTATKAKVIRADLEAASKARNKLTATYKKEDSKMIQQLYQQMVDLEGLGSYLPSLVERLQQLSHLHRQASTFGTRLQELERGTTQVEATVVQLEDGMTTLQTTIVQNIAAMENNLQELDKKLSGL